MSTEDLRYVSHESVPFQAQPNELRTVSEARRQMAGEVVDVYSQVLERETAAEVRRNETSPDHLVNKSGDISPESEFPNIPKFIILVRCEKDGGRPPVSWLSERFIKERLVQEPSSEGMVEFRLAEFKSRCSSFPSFPREEGIGPPREFP
ncbi:hypothetical protein M5K25_021830 [Dendrobium thyrsiflorum]|uniref:Uncharacterized protein n=1 Tax=Dendrobium thyrsiflorum TaxID=117978 RepID=A0ABD0U5A3_DENTH